MNVKCKKHPRYNGERRKRKRYCDACHLLFIVRWQKTKQAEEKLGGLNPFQFVESKRWDDALSELDGSAAIVSGSAQAVSPLVCMTNDLILSNLKLPDPCPVRIEIDEKYIRLFVGQRDWQWRKDGSMVGAGTGLCQLVAEDAG